MATEIVHKQGGIEGGWEGIRLGGVEPMVIRVRKALGGEWVLELFSGKPDHWWPLSYYDKPLNAVRELQDRRDADFVIPICGECNQYSSRISLWNTDKGLQVSCQVCGESATTPHVQSAVAKNWLRAALVSAVLYMGGLIGWCVWHF